MLARLVPVNINYRYTGNELAHLFTAGRLAGLVVDAEHAPLAAAVAAGSPDLRHVLVTGSGTLAASFPAGITAVDYDRAIAAARPVLPDNDRSGDDKIIIFTGGTTGLPRGVLWRHEDFYFSLLLGGNPTGPPRLAVGEVAAACERPAGGYVLTPLLMNGAGTQIGVPGGIKHRELAGLRVHRGHPQRAGGPDAGRQPGLEHLPPVGLGHGGHRQRPPADPRPGPLGVPAGLHVPQQPADEAPADPGGGLGSRRRELGLVQPLGLLPAGDVRADHRAGRCPDDHVGRGQVDAQPGQPRDQARLPGDAGDTAAAQD